MPTYEYRCKSCDEHFEVVQSFTDKALTKHKGCGGQLRKVFAAPGISFKGSGFYKTDTRGSSKGSSSESSSESTSSSTDSSSSSDSTSKDSKPAEKKADKKSDAKATSTS